MSGSTTITHLKFSPVLDADFVKILRKRVNAYFKDSNIQKGANGRMLWKSAISFSIYLLPFFFVLLGEIQNMVVLFASWIIMGFGKAMVGISVMHDSVHGAYSKKRWVNKMMAFSARLIGMDPEVWKIQHNVLHHTYPNIEGMDEDIAPRYIMRFSPNQPRKWFHRFQHIYVWLIYSLTTLLWVSAKDYFKIFHYRKMNLLSNDSSFNAILLKMIMYKVMYFSVFLVLPMYVLPVSTFTVLLLFISMHVTAGLTLSMIFQTGHVMTETDFLETDELTVERNWTVHQLMTTTNFAIDNKLVTWFTGGLNFQVEHHLFPNICHVHYPELSKIVRQTTKEFNMPYLQQETMGTAINDHYNMLKNLGRKH